MSGTGLDLTGSRLQNATRVNQALEDADVIDWEIGDYFILCTMLEAVGHGGADVTIRIDWRNVTDSGTFTQLVTTGEIIRSAGGTDLVNVNAVTSGESVCTPVAGTTWVNGQEHENAYLGAVVLLQNQYTEHQWALDTVNALANKQYEFQIYDVTEGAAVGTCLAQITVKYPELGFTTNSPDALVVTEHKAQVWLAKSQALTLTTYQATIKYDVNVNTNFRVLALPIIEVDTNNRLTIADSKVTGVDAGKDDEYYVYRDYGVDYFSGDFVHEFEYNISSASGPSALLFTWGLSNNLADHYTQDVNDYSCLAVYNYTNSGSPVIRIREIDGANNYLSTATIDTSADTTYYARVRRDESVGTYGTFYLELFSDAARTTQVGSTLSLALHTSKKDFRYYYLCWGYYDGSTTSDADVDFWTDKHVTEGYTDGYQGANNLLITDYVATVQADVDVNITTNYLLNPPLITEVDTNNRITLAGSKATAVDAGWDDTFYLYRDYGIDHFNGDFTHEFEFNYSSLSGSSARSYLWMVSNNIGDHRVHDLNNFSCLTLYVFDNSGSPNIRVMEIDTSNNYTSVVIDISSDTTYYARVRRDESWGANGILYLEIYSDAERTTQVGATVSVGLHTSKKDFRYYYLCTGYDGGNSSSAYDADYWVDKHVTEGYTDGYGTSNALILNDALPATVSVDTSFTTSAPDALVVTTYQAQVGLGISFTTNTPPALVVTTYQAGVNAAININTQTIVTQLFTEYVEVDELSNITVTDNRVTQNGVNTNEDAYVYKDFGVDFFNADFTHDFTIHIDTTTASNISSEVTHWMMSNAIGTIQSHINASDHHFRLYVDQDNGGTPRVYIKQQVGGSSSAGPLLLLSENTTYYARIYRDDAYGTYGRIYVYFYADADRKDLVDSRYLNIFSLREDFRYLYSANSPDTGTPPSDKNATGWMEDLATELDNEQRLTTSTYNSDIKFDVNFTTNTPPALVVATYLADVDLAGSGTNINTNYAASNTLTVTTFQAGINASNNVDTNVWDLFSATYQANVQANIDTNITTNTPDALVVTTYQAGINAAVSFTTSTPVALAVSEQQAGVNAEIAFTTNTPDALIVTDYLAGVELTNNVAFTTNVPDALVVATYQAGINAATQFTTNTPPALVVTDYLAGVQADVDTNITTNTPPALIVATYLAGVNAAIEFTTNTPDALVVSEQQAEINAAIEFTTNTPPALIVTDYLAGVELTTDVAFTTNAPDALIITTYQAGVNAATQFTTNTPDALIVTDYLTTIQADIDTNITTNTPVALVVSEQQAEINAEITFTTNTPDTLVVTTYQADVQANVDTEFTTNTPPALAVATYLAGVELTTDVAFTTNTPPALVVATYQANVNLDVSIDVDTDPLILSEQSAIVNAAKIISAGVVALAISTNVAAITFDVKVDATKQTLNVSTYQANIQADVDTNITTNAPDALIVLPKQAGVNASISFTTNAPPTLTVTAGIASIALGNDISINAIRRQLTLTTFKANVNVPVEFTTNTPVALVVTDYLQDIRLNKSIAATSVTLTVADFTAEINAETNFTTNAPPALVVTPYTADINVGTLISANTVALSIAEQQAEINAATQFTTNTPDALIVTTYTADINSDTTIDAGIDTLVIATYQADVILNTSIDATVVALTTATYKAFINASTNVSATSDALTLTPLASDINFGIGVSVGVRTLTLQEQQADINAATNVDAGVDALVVSTYKSTVNSELVIDVGVDALVVTTFQAGVNAAIQFTTNTPDALTVTGGIASVAVGNDVPINTVSVPLSLTTYAATVNIPTNIDATSQSLSVTTYIADIDLNTSIAATSQALSVTTYIADLNIATGIDTNADALTVTTYNANVNPELNITTNLDALTLTTYTASINTGLVILATSQPLIVTTYQATIAATVDTDITTNLETLAITTYPATIGLHKDIAFNSQSLNVATYDFGLNVATGIGANVDNLTVITYPANINAGVNLTTNLQTLAVATQQADINVNLIVNTTSQSLSVTTYETLVSASSLITISSDSHTCSIKRRDRAVKLIHKDRSIKII